MKKQEIINTLRAQYTRDIRKQLVKSLLEAEKNKEIEQTYELMNQIFSYVLAQSGWTMVENTTSWDGSPLEIMADIFPKIETSQWYKEQELQVKQTIDVKMDSIQ